MGPAEISVLFFFVLFVTADIQLTQYVVRHDYSIHNCSQLLRCGTWNILGLGRKSECAQQALQTGVDLFMYEIGNKSCHLCLQRSPSDGITEVPASQPVYVKGM